VIAGKLPAGRTVEFPAVLLPATAVQTISAGKTRYFVLAVAKAFFHRGRPTGSLVGTVGASFPSGHAVTGAATAVALVLVLMPAGPARRRWERVAVAFAFVMATSRVYLHAHWLSDVVAGVLLGTGVALGTAALGTEVRDHVLRRRQEPPRVPP